MTGEIVSELDSEENSDTLNDWRVCERTRQWKKKRHTKILAGELVSELDSELDSDTTNDGLAR